MRSRKAVGWGELIVGVLLIILGIYTFIRPAAALEGATLIYGIFALVTGIMDIVYYVKLEQRTGSSHNFNITDSIRGFKTNKLSYLLINRPPLF